MHVAFRQMFVRLIHRPGHATGLLLAARRLAVAPLRRFSSPADQEADSRRRRRKQQRPVPGTVVRDAGPSLDSRTAALPPHEGSAADEAVGSGSAAAAAAVSVLGEDDAAVKVAVPPTIVGGEAPLARLSRLSAHCTARRYRMSDLRAEVQRTMELSAATYWGDDAVLHLKTLPMGGKEDGHDVFVFDGSVVFWSATKEEERAFMERIGHFQVDKHSLSEFETMSWQLATFSGLKGDVVNIDEAKQEAEQVKLKLAVSHALARSVRLSVFEEHVKRTMVDMRSISRDLMTKQRISMSPKECLKHIGELLYLRGEVNLHSDLLEPPEMLWEHPRLEALFETMMAEMDVDDRVDVVNRKLDSAAELVEAILVHLSERMGHRLEIIIIVLIAAELGMYVMDHHALGNV